MEPLSKQIHNYLTGKLFLIIDKDYRANIPDRTAFLHGDDIRQLTVAIEMQLEGPRCRGNLIEIRFGKEVHHRGKDLTVGVFIYLNFMGTISSYDFDFLIANTKS